MLRITLDITTCKYVVDVTHVQITLDFRTRAQVALGTHDTCVQLALDIITFASFSYRL